MTIQRAPTLSDVAALANVHTTTASKVLHHTRGGSRVSETTRQRVLDAATQLHYSVNAVARSLRSRSTNLIGLSSPHVWVSVRTPFWAEIIEGLQIGCETHQKDLLIYSNFRDHSIEYIFSELINGKIDGLLLLTSPEKQLEELLVNSSLPVVAIADSLPKIPSVCADDVSGAHLIAQHLADKGHKRVLYRIRPNAPTSIARRYTAFCDHAVKLGISVETAFSNWTEAPSDSEKERLLAHDSTRPTAAVCMEDTTAYALVDHCRDLGLRVPDDLAVVGFDGVQPMIRPPYNLTTVRAPWLEIAQKALALLVDKLNGEIIPQNVQYPVQLIEGDTT